MKDFQFNVEALLSALKVAPIFESVFEEVKELNQTEFYGLLATIIDAWAAHHEMTKEETFEILAALTVAQRQVHEEHGSWE